MHPVMMMHAKTVVEIDAQLDNTSLSRKTRRLLQQDRKRTVKMIAQYTEQINKVFTN